MKRLYLSRALRKPTAPRLKRLPRQLYPEQIEERYARALGGILSFVKGRVDEKIKPLIPKLVAHYGRARADADDAPEKYYLAFIYKKVKGADVLHCTHKYLGELTREELNQVEKVVDGFFLRERPLPWVQFTKPRLFGPNQDIRVLTASTSDPRGGFSRSGDPFREFNELRLRLDKFRKDDFPYAPHVTTGLKKIEKRFSHYALISKRGIHRAWPKTIKMDADDEASLGDLADDIASIRLEVEEAYTPDEIKRLAGLTGKSVEEFNAAQLNGQLHHVVEIDVFGSEPWLAREMGAFVIQNVSLISSIGDEYLNQVEKMIASSVRGGVRVESIADELEERYDVSRSRAELIARDQVGKFNGQLTELRQTELGIDKYRWRDSGDARVRDSHRENARRETEFGEGVYAWDDPPETGHPGEDYQCRCWAEPDLSKFYDE